MRNREIVMRKVEMVEGQIRILKSMVSKPDFTREQFDKILKTQEDLLQEIKDYVDKEQIMNR